MSGVGGRRAGRDILIISTADWDHPFWTNKQHMAALFAAHGYRVLYVDSLGLRKPGLNQRDLWRMGRRLIKALAGTSQVRPNLWRLSPLALPWHGSSLIRALNARLLPLMIRLALRFLRMERPLIWTYDPLAVNFYEALPRRGLVYHCVDDLGATPGIDAAAIREAEARLAPKADLCFTTAPSLQGMAEAVGFSQVCYESNVCDYDHFSRARGAITEPDDLRGIPRPRLIFVGMIGRHKVDPQLLEVLAQKLPQAHLVLIGEMHDDDSSLPAGSNIHYLGPKTYAELPEYLGNAEVALIPAPMNDYTLGMFPMKFYEYLAAGLPVVATALPSLKEVAGLCFLAEGSEDFAQAVKRVLAGERRDPDEIEKACHYHSWEARFLRMEERIETFWANEHP